jgi:hypothetical protein
MSNSRLRSLIPLFAAVVLWSCGGGGDSDDSGQGAPPPPAPAPAPTPPAPAPTPPAPAPIPPLGQPALDISGTAAPVGIDYWGDNSDAAGGKGETIDGIPCRPMDETFHVHTHLAIVLNGQLLSIPQQLGQVPATTTAAGCFYQIHNHDKAGRLHIESPVPVSYTLGSFFKIWGQPLSSTNIAGITGLPVVVYVTDNGNTMRHTGDPATIELRSKRLITIQIGTQLNTIPNFNWTGT